VHKHTITVHNRNRYIIFIKNFVLFALFLVCVRLLISMTTTKDKWRLGMDRHCFSLGDFERENLISICPFRLIIFLFAELKFMCLVHCYYFFSLLKFKALINQF
jgi:hypothetical protein